MVALKVLLPYNILNMLDYTFKCHRSISEYSIVRRYTVNDIALNPLHRRNFPTVGSNGALKILRPDHGPKKHIEAWKTTNLSINKCSISSDGKIFAIATSSIMAVKDVQSEI